MNSIKRITCLVLALIMILSCCVFAKTDSMGNFVKNAKYESGHFEDVPEDKWYAADVKSTFEYGLFRGVGENVFNPSGNITVAETITLAVRLNSLFRTGKVFADAGTQPWYQCYLDYALENAIAGEELCSENAVNSFATRAQFAEIMAKAIPLSECKAINSVADGMVPDIPENAAYYDSVYAFYRAGILTGSDSKGSFLPSSNIRRCEVAAVIARMVDPSMRKNVLIKQDSSVTENIDGIAVTKLPYTSSGITAESISFAADRKSAGIKLVNNTGYALSKYTNLPYTCYDAKGRTIKTGLIGFEDMNAGESLDTVFALQEGTAKIIFGSANFYKGLQAEETSVTEYDKIFVTNLPYTSKGLTIKSVKIDSSDAAKPKATFVVENNSGDCVSGRSAFEYRCYNSSGKQLASASFYLLEMNNAESCMFDITLAEGTKKLILGDATVVNCDRTETTEMQEKGKLNVTKAPYESNGLVIESVEVSGTSVKCKVTNRAGFMIQDISNFRYKCYNADGNVIETGSMYLKDLTDGSSYTAKITLPGGTRKLVFGTGTVYKK